MKIVLVVNQFPKVSETFIYRKVQGLAQKGHSVYIIASRVNTVLYKEVFKSRRNIYVRELSLKNLLKHSFFRIHKFLSLNKNWLFTKLFISIVNDINADIVHFEFSGIGVQFLHALDKIKGKKIVGCRGSAELINLLVDKERKTSISLLFKKVDYIVCNSSHTLSAVKPYLPNLEKIGIIYPSVDSEFYCRKFIKGATEDLIILSVGRLTFQKGFFIGLLAAKHLKKITQNFKWLIVGEGIMHNEIIFHIKMMGLSNNVFLLGEKTQRELKDLYNETDIYLFPSVSEGLGNSALEAMSMNLPVIATKSGGISEVIEDGKDGFLVDNYDSQKLAEKILYLANNLTTRESIGFNARQKVISNFKSEIKLEEIVTLYLNLLKNND